MKKINCPVLIYHLTDHLVLGILVGTSYSLIDKSVNKVKQGLQSYLLALYKKNGFYRDFGEKAPRMKMLYINIHPTYQDYRGTFPMIFELRIPIPCVFIENDQSSYHCFLPVLNRRFHFYQKKQLQSLAAHFAKAELNKMLPEQLHRISLYGEPELESISIRVNVNRNNQWNWGFDWKQPTQMLNRLTEPYPYNRAAQKKLQTSPDVAWEMEEYVDEILDFLLQQRASVIVVGAHGVGKSAILKQTFRKMAQQRRKRQSELTCWQIMSQRITTSAKYLGEWQQNTEELIKDLKTVKGVLWVQDLMELVRIGGQGAEDSVAAFMQHFIRQGELLITGELTPAELNSMRRLLPGFVELFQIIEIPPLKEATIHKILQHFADYSLKNYKIQITDKAVSRSFSLLSRYYPNESFPGKAIKLLSRAVGKAALSKKQKITPEEIRQLIIEETGLPELFVNDDILLNQAELRQYFSKNIIGQPEAVEQMMSLVKIFKAGLNDPHKPIQTLLFAGPTGVGKTASAKVLANYFFGKGSRKNPLIRIDMSEFQHPGMIYRFIGTGKEPGKLVQLVRERPFAVLLLDEVEKASPIIFDALLTVLDEGMLMDAYGRITSFRNSIIIMTSNLGASNRQSIGFSTTEAEDIRYHAAINRFFRPEFVNRIDTIINFRSLDADAIRQITLKELHALQHREGLVKKNIQLIYSDALLNAIAAAGFDPQYGARLLQRAIENMLVNPIASWLLKHPDTKNKTLQLDFQQGLVIEVL